MKVVILAGGFGDRILEALFDNKKSPWKVW